MKVNILVVDDRPEGLMAVSAVLKSPMYNLVMANSGMEALKYLLEEDFAVILMDVQMPGMNGFETAEIIKTRDKSKNIPIIFMSAISQDEQYVYQGYKVGAIDYLLKPFDPYILQSKVGIFVELYQKNIQLMEQAKLIHDNEIKSYAQAMDKLELEGLRKYRHLADSIPQIVFRLLPNGHHEYFNKVWFEYTGLSIERSQGEGWKDAIHPDDLTTVNYSLYREEVSEVEIECRILSKNGEYRWHLLQFGPEKYNNLKQVDAWLGTATDIEEMKRTESFQRLLVNAGEVLVSSLDYNEIFKQIAELVTEEMSEVCLIEVINDGKLETVSHHSRSETGAENSISNAAKSAVIETGKSLFQPDLIIVPLVIHGRILGLLSLRSTDKSYDQAHLKTAEELGRRTAMVLENSQLYDLSQKAIDVRNEFLSIASHELKTPVTSLKLQLQMAQRLLNNDDPNARKRFPSSLHSSLKQVDRLIGLIHLLLDVSKIQSGKFFFSFEKTNVSEVIQEAMERNKETFSYEGCELSVSNIPNLPVTWDKVRIEQVIINLLMNAVKYAPGKIELDVREQDQMVVIAVRDYGKGIDMDKINTIFDRFTRATGDSIAGMGLGLYIVKEIVEGHNGTIEVQSSSKGSTFRVFLPIDNPGFKLKATNLVDEMEVTL